MISVVTINFNDKVGLGKTISSVIDQRRFYSDLEYIVIDGASSDGSLKVIEDNANGIDKYISEPDAGIYDAMNKGIEMASGDFLLFMNSGDYFVGDVLSSFGDEASFLPVMYESFYGRKGILKIKSLKRGLPNCHQGIVFENKRIYYDLKYRLSSDYDFYIRHGYDENLRFVNCDGYVYYDNSGLSSTNISERDHEMFNIRNRNFGFLNALVFEVEPFIKRMIRKVF